MKQKLILPKFQKQIANIRVWVEFRSNFAGATAAESSAQQGRPSRLSLAATKRKRRR